MNAKSEYLNRAALLLDIVATAPAGLTLTQLSSISGLPTATTHRIVNSLVEVEYLEGSGKRNTVFMLGGRLRRLFQNLMSPEILKITAKPLLKRLADRFEEVAFLGRLVGHEVELVTAVLPDYSSNALIHPGNTFPLNTSSITRAIIAHQPDEEWEQILDEIGPQLKQYRPTTVVDIDDMRKQLLQVREQGYAISDDDLGDGIYAFSMPVCIDGAGVFLGIGVVGLKSRMMRFSVDEFQEEVSGVTKGFASSFRDAMISL